MGGVLSVLGDAAGAAAGAANRALHNGPLVTAVGIPLGLGTVVGLATLPPIFTWYQKLNKPKWTPPDPVFGQVWSALYGLMGYASYLVWRKTGWPSQPLYWYAAQLGMNLAWQLLFFTAKKPKAALVENAVLLGAVAYTTVEFWKVDPLAGQIMLPYLAFNGFALALNKAIVDRNPQFQGKPKATPGGTGAGTSTRNPKAA